MMGKVEIGLCIIAVECLPMVKMYVVSLSDAERLVLQQTVKDKRSSLRKATQARVLLKADAGPEGREWSDTKIAEAFEVRVATVERLRKRAVTESIETALTERRHGTVPPKLCGEQEARLSALQCSQPPKGHKRWTLHLLANRFSDREGVPVSYELIRRTLKKTGYPLT